MQLRVVRKNMELFSEALALAIIKMIKNPALREKLSENGRKRVKERFSVEEYVKRSTDIFRVICS